MCDGLTGDRLRRDRRKRDRPRRDHPSPARPNTSASDPRRTRNIRLTRNLRVRSNALARRIRQKDPVAMSHAVERKQAIVPMTVLTEE
jgi:hypothetical protein